MFEKSITKSLAYVAGTTLKLMASIELMAGRLGKNAYENMVCTPINQCTILAFGMA